MTLDEGKTLEIGDIIQSCVEGEIINKENTEDGLVIIIQQEDDQEGNLIFGDGFNLATEDCLKYMRILLRNGEGLTKMRT